MTTGENATQDSKNQEFFFKGCEEMMKMMSRCMQGKGEKFDFEKFCGNMPTCCADMMKKAEEKKD